MELTVTTTAQCPYCWEEVEIVVDTSQGDYTTIEDCSVCCRPWELVVRCEAGRILSVETGPC
jgi:hypothetical protein